ncbi:hypothetical protein BS50DRAFT_26789 [Corynespora cassiicola Philippines]|uniref:Uncharacterized protein n=1 Tax=Corynespora cassiicola Philippines TaxID=1448308 RepID=A0A2T2PB69_CORCC|nr:hypothetical protein BS50DRAFT_26789 [Corynespora cassiicola Philippines]
MIHLGPRGIWRLGWIKRAWNVVVDDDVSLYPYQMNWSVWPFGLTLTCATHFCSTWSTFQSSFPALHACPASPWSLQSHT